MCCIVIHGNSGWNIGDSYRTSFTLWITVTWIPWSSYACHGMNDHHAYTIIIQTHCNSLVCHVIWMDEARIICEYLQFNKREVMNTRITQWQTKLRKEIFTNCSRFAEGSTVYTHNTNTIGPSDNSFSLSDAYMHWWFGWVFVQVFACCFCSTKSLGDAMMTISAKLSDTLAKINAIWIQTRWLSFENTVCNMPLFCFRECVLMLMNKLMNRHQCQWKLCSFSFLSAFIVCDSNYS